MHHVGHAREVLHNAVVVGRGENHGGHIGMSLEQRGKVSLVGHAVALIDSFDIDVVVAGIGVDHGAHGRAEGGGNEHTPALAERCHGHHHGFGCGSGAVVHRGVRHGQTRQACHHGLVLEDILQCALRYFRLIWGVGGEKFRTSRYGKRGRRSHVVVEAASGKAYVHRGVFGCQAVEITAHVVFAELAGKIVRLLQAQFLRDIGIQVGERFHSADFKHLGYVGPGVWKISVHVGEMCVGTTNGWLG